MTLQEIEQRKEMKKKNKAFMKDNNVEFDPQRREDYVRKINGLKTSIYFDDKRIDLEEIFEKASKEKIKADEVRAAFEKLPKEFKEEFGFDFEIREDEWSENVRVYEKNQGESIPSVFIEESNKFLNLLRELRDEYSIVVDKFSFSEAWVKLDITKMTEEIHKERTTENLNILKYFTDGIDKQKTEWLKERLLRRSEEYYHHKNNLAEIREDDDFVVDGRYIKHKKYGVLTTNVWDDFIMKNPNAKQRLVERELKNRAEIAEEERKLKEMEEKILSIPHVKLKTFMVGNRELRAYYKGSIFYKTDLWSQYSLFKAYEHILKELKENGIIED